MGWYVARDNEGITAMVERRVSGGDGEVLGIVKGCGGAFKYALKEQQ